MAPEQLLGRSSDHRADQFSFGTTLYELLKGRNPFQRETGPQTIAAILETTPRLDVGPEPLSSIVNRCLAKDPAQRYSSTRELARALKTVQQPAAAPVRPAMRKGLLPKALIATLVLCVVAAGVWKWRSTILPSEPRVLAMRSFRNLSGDPQYVYYTGAITDEIRSRVSLLSSVRLLARSAVDRYSEADTAKIGSALNADVVLDGEVLASKGQLQLKVQLRDARTLKTLWSRQYDRAHGEIPVLRGQVALDVASAADAPVTADERRRLERRPTTNEEAYDLYLQAKKARSLGRDALARTLSLLKQAVELDPRFADAMADIGYLLHLRGDPRDNAEAINWAQKALAIDPDSAQAHQSLGAAYSGAGAVTKSRAAFKRAIELDPNNTVALNNFSIVTAQVFGFRGRAATDAALARAESVLHRVVLSPVHSVAIHRVLRPVRAMDSTLAGALSCRLSCRHFGDPARSPSRRFSRCSCTGAETG
jgi:TolB-like protein